jgi:CRISPR-associated protein Cmr4
MKVMGGKLFWIVALTALHPGVGRGEGAHVDLPVQRDEFGLPAIWASSLKGALRAKAERGLFHSDGRSAKCVDDPAQCARVLAAFGPRPEEASEFASPVAFLDAKLVAIPARSLKGVWLYVTSPLLLSFAALYAEALGCALKLPEIPRPGSGTVYLSDNRYSVNGHAVINERKYRVAGRAPALDLPPFQEVRRMVGEVGFAVASDDDIAGIVRRSLLVQYRVRLKQDTKTVETGPWSEEYIPPFTVFVSGYYCAGRRPSVVSVSVSMDKEKKCADGEVDEERQACRKRVRVDGDPCDYVSDMIRGPVWLGGKETIGRGLVKVIL